MPVGLVLGVSAAQILCSRWGNHTADGATEQLQRMFILKLTIYLFLYWFLPAASRAEMHLQCSQRPLGGNLGADGTKMCCSCFETFVSSRHCQVATTRRLHGRWML
jgi:hypothetical protein